MLREGNLLDAAMQVYDSIRSDIGTKKRDRVVRIEVGPRRSVAPASINDLEKQMAEALKLTFSIRQAAYDDAVILGPLSLKVMSLTDEDSCSLACSAFETVVSSKFHGTHNSSKTCSKDTPRQGKQS